jgi:hypothetical protein
VSNVHTGHCCIQHGCKYGDEEQCPVATGTERQDHPCEFCSMDAEPGQRRRIEVQFKNRKGDWQVAILQTAIGRGIYRNTWLSFAEGEAENPYADAYENGRKYQADNPDAELRVIEIVETVLSNLTAMVVED